MITVCALLYGNHQQLAHRCLSSICEATDKRAVREIRVGLNEVSRAGESLARSLVEKSGVSWRIYKEACGSNVLKYPMMRAMFYEPPPIRTPWTMWFDDDSYIKGSQAEIMRWWDRIWGMVSDPHAPEIMIGSVYTMPFKGKQRAAIQNQPWFRGKPWEHDRRGRECFRFCTGGWWLIRTALLHKFNYPIPDLRHQGGDRILGEMCRQNSTALRHFNDGIAINADSVGRESKASQRGVKEPAIWEKWDPNNSPDLSHHQWNIEATSSV